MDDFADTQGINDLMFDASFDRSKAYFSALQLLRLVDERLADIGTDRVVFALDNVKDALVGI